MRRSSGILSALLICLLFSACVQDVPKVRIDDAPDASAELLRVDPGNPEAVIHEEGTFLDLIRQKNRIVLIDFWGPHCGPCVQMTPELESVAKRFPNQVSIVKVDVEKSANADLVRFFAIQAIPDVRMLVNGEPAERFLGYVDEAKLVQYIQPHLASLTPQ